MHGLLCLIFCLGSAGEWSFDMADLPDYVASIASMTVTPEGDVYFLDDVESHIYRLDAGGHYAGHFGGKGEGPGEIEMGFKLQYLPMNQSLYVFDQGRKRIAHFHKDGRFVGDYVVTPNVCSPSSWLLDPTHIVYIDMPLSAEQTKKGAVIRLLNLETGEDKVLQRLDHHHHGDPGRMENDHTQIITIFPWTPTARVVVEPGKRLFVGSTAILDFKVYDAAAAEITHTLRDESLKPRPLTDEEIKDFEKRSQMKVTLPDQVYRASFLNFFIDGSSRLWARVNPPVGIGQHRYRVYDPRGEFVGKLNLPGRPRFELYHADDRYLWLVIREEVDGEMNIVIKKQTYRLN